MALPPGTRVGAYEIRALLGAGGMGEVYRAHDSRLARDVALKVLPAELAHDRERLLHLEREARIVASLNHPNIVTLYALDEVDGRHFLVMECVTGHPLTDLIEPGGLPLNRILDLAIPVAAALKAAHEQDVVHRDLKPANVMVSDTGWVKVLDFGLAKPTTSSMSTGTSTETLSSDERVVGTIPYMAPEQLRGDRVDARADLFAFGTMLYEMATGVRPFQGRSGMDVASAILRESPRPLEDVRPELPPAFTRIVTRCLEKDPGRRMQAATELLHQLQQLANGPAVAEAHRLVTVPTSGPASGPEVKGLAVAADSEAGARVGSGTTAGLRKRLARRVAVAGLGLVLVGAAATLVPRLWSPRPVPADVPGITSIAVLPFDNLTHDASQDYFVEGMHGALITDLAKLGAVRVTSRNSVMRYKGQTVDLKEVAKQLGVDALIEGSVLRAGNKVRITAQLILGRTDEHVWAESYDRDLEDVLALLSDVSRAIAGEVQARLDPGRVTTIEPVLAILPRVRPEAYEAYLRGRDLEHKAGNSRASLEALEHFERAAALDPGFAKAWSWIGLLQVYRWFFGAAPAAEALPAAREAAQKAVSLDPRDGDGHAALGLIELYFEWNFAAARSRLERAVALNPHDFVGRHAYADYLMLTGRFDESLEQVRLAKSANPGSPVSYTVVAFHAMAAGKFDDAVFEARTGLDTFAGSPMLRAVLGDALWHQGRYEEALPELKGGFAGDTEGWTRFETGYHRTGPTAAFKAYADLLAERGQGRSSNPLRLANVFAGAGQTDAVFQYLEQAYALRLPQLLHIVADPAYDGIREDPRFEELMRRIGIPRVKPPR